MNAVLIAVIVMLVLALLRVHVVVALFLGALTGGLLSGMGLDATMVAFQDGLGGGAKIALSYALLGAFAMGVAATGLPQLLANFLIRRISPATAGTANGASPRAASATKWILVVGLIAMAVMSQNVIPVHIHRAAAAQGDERAAHRPPTYHLLPDLRLGHHLHVPAGGFRLHLLERHLAV